MSIKIQLWDSCFWFIHSCSGLVCQVYLKLYLKISRKVWCYLEFSSKMSFLCFKMPCRLLWKNYKISQSFGLYLMCYLKQMFLKISKGSDLIIVKKSSHIRYSSWVRTSVYVFREMCYNSMCGVCRILNNNINKRL